MTPCPQNVMDKAELENKALDTLVIGGLRGIEKVAPDTLARLC